MKNKTPDPQMQVLRKHMELRKEYQDTCEIRIDEGKDQYIKHLETLVIAYREKFGHINIEQKG